MRAWDVSSVKASNADRAVLSALLQKSEPLFVHGNFREFYGFKVGVIARGGKKENARSEIRDGKANTES